MNTKLWIVKSTRNEFIYSWRSDIFEAREDIEYYVPHKDFEIIESPDIKNTREIWNEFLRFVEVI